MYIHELADWPRFHWDRERLAKPLAEVRHRQGLLIGHMGVLGFNLRQEAVLQTLTADSSQRFYSMSAEIRQERTAYYDILEQTQKGDVDITPWMEWFLGCLGRAIDGAQTVLSAVLAKARFWERLHGVSINDRQRLVLNRLLDGFEGKLTTSKYAKLTKSSPDTALRDIAHLVEHGILVRSSEGGRSTSYALANVP